MPRIIMIAALIFLTTVADAQTETYGGAGGPYTPLKFVVNDSLFRENSEDSTGYFKDSLQTRSVDSVHRKLVGELRFYGEIFSTLTDK